MFTPTRFYFWPLVVLPSFRPSIFNVRHSAKTDKFKMTSPFFWRAFSFLLTCKSGLCHRLS
jgi:hypothetical protein